MAMLERVQKIPFIATGFVSMDPFAMLTTLVPLPLVVISTWTFPYTLPVFLPLTPVAFIDLAVIPFKDTLPFSLAFGIESPPIDSIVSHL